MTETDSRQYVKEPFYAGLEDGKNQNLIMGLNVEVADPKIKGKIFEGEIRVEICGEIRVRIWGEIRVKSWDERVKKSLTNLTSHSDKFHSNIKFIRT